MSDSFDDNNNENNKYNSIIESSNNVKYETSSNITSPLSVNEFLRDLLQELHVILLDIEDYSIVNEFIHNFLLENNLDHKNVLEIMTSNPQLIFCYSSLIGIFYQYGIGCEVDKIKAFEIFSNAVKNNRKAILDQFSFDLKNETVSLCNDDIKELNEIITLYFYSLFLYNDIILNKMKYYKLYIKNAEKGDSVSQYHIGNHYCTKGDFNKAIEWYSKSSEGGNIKAMYMLAYCYANGYGIKKDKRKSFELYLKSAEGGYKNALWILGDEYYHGYNILKDKIKAFGFYLKAAEKGHYLSQYLVANYYYDGKYIPKNEGKWVYWNKKAAINGNVDAQFELAEYYVTNSVNKNEGKAFKWYMKLANENRLGAYYLVAKCYRDGIGTDKDLEEATIWIKKYELSKYYRKPQITLNDFFNGSDIDVSSIALYKCYTWS
jgi:TPR repeat protein